MKEIIITSSVLIAALLLLRLLFAKKVSRRLIYAAWLLVALRLLIPVQIGQMNFSVLTAAKPLTDTISEFTDLRVAGQTEMDAHKQVIADYIEKDPTAFTPVVQERIEAAVEDYYSTEEIADMIRKIYSVEDAFQPEVQEQVSREIAEQTNPVSLGRVLTVFWLVGVAAMGGWFLFVNLRYGKNLRLDAQRLECDSPIPVYVSEFADSPCLAGLLRPVIFLTPFCAENEEMRRHVLTHELTHYRHRDHIWAILRCLCLCVYWFHPLVWVAVYVSRRDCELACDEGALEKLGQEERIPYGKTLLEVVRHRAYPSDWLQTATSMTETKRELKQRVNFIAQKPKISFIAAVAMMLVCAIVAGCAAAGPGIPREEQRQMVYLPASYKLTSEKETIDRTYTYNELGQIIQFDEEWISEERGHIKTQRTYQYDDHGNLTRETWYQTRDKNGRFQESGGEKVHLYTYDEKGRVTEYRCDDEDYVFSFQYDDRNNRITMTHQEDNWWCYYQYDKDGRITQELTCSLLAEGYQPDWEYRYDLRTFAYTKEGKIQVYAGKLGYANEKLDLSGLDRVEEWRHPFEEEFYYDDRGNLTGVGKPDQYQYDENNHLILQDRTETITIRGEMVERILAKYTRDEQGNVLCFEDYRRAEEVTYVALELTADQAKAARSRMVTNLYSYNVFADLERVVIKDYPYPWSYDKMACLIPGAPW